MTKILLHLKFGFQSLDDAVEFYEKAGCNHIVKAPYWGEGRQQEIFYVDKPVKYTGDPDIGMEQYNLAVAYPTFIQGSVESALEEFTYLPGYRVVKLR